MAEVRFCEECNNILYAKSDKKSKKLIYVCRSCEYISLKPNENNNIVARINYNYDRKEDIYIHPETKNDPALGRVRDWTCKQCGNNEAVFLQLAEKISYNPMALIYVCTNKNCYYWEKEAQKINDDNYFKSDKSSDISEDEDLLNKNFFIKQEKDNFSLLNHDDNIKKNKKAWRTIKEEGDDDEDDEEKKNKQEEEEGNKLQQELYKILNLNDKKSNDELQNEVQSEVENDYDINVEEYFCEE
ncbi:DNA-directed RNA polymerase 2, putative [Plasmodium gaboni]|uniref:DNA-directed RNA polymerase 2, putative n=1 Tax=Plasmodium gaboni TaxID=647221 RepID=A0ABY1UGY9_9APIC|nr:DNA-directed RNA polymerase 2, putative [Plasmodium gaboni]